MIKELLEVKNIIYSNISPLGKIALEYIFQKIEEQTNIKWLKNLAYQYYTILKDPKYLKIHKRFFSQTMPKLFSIKIEDSDSFLLQIKPNYSIFDCQAILDIYDFVNSFLHYKKLFIEFAKNNNNLKEIYQFISSTHNFKDFINTIDHFIDKNGSIKTNATEELKKIREEIHNLNKLVPSKLSDFIKENHKYLLSNEIAYRNGRFVVLLNSQYVNNFDGIVQDFSWTHKTAFFEPNFIINYNNRLTLLQSLESIEIQKILTIIFNKITDNLLNIANVFKVCSLLEFLDVYFSLSPIFCDVSKNHGKLEIKGLLNPLISNCVPIDVQVDNGLMIVGPNNGGKSVALKSITLAILFSNVGLPIWASKANIPYLKVFYDVPDSQSIKDGISTFYGHVKYWEYIIKNFEKNSIIIMDEPASGTDPDQASIITIAIVEYFLNKGAFVIFTTHFNKVKYYFYKKISTASVFYDFVNNRSLYKLVYGVLLPSYPLNLLSNLPFELNQKIKDIANNLESNHFENKIQEVFYEISKIYQNLHQQELTLQQKLNEVENMKKQIKEKAKKEVFNKLYQEYSIQIQNLIKNWQKELEKLKNKQEHSKLERRLKTIENFDLYDYLYSQEIPVLQENDFVKLKLFDEIGVVKKIKGNRLEVEVNGKIYNVSIDEVKRIVLNP